MAFFVDANVVVYTASEGPYHDACREVLSAIAEGAEGRLSTAVLEEVWHVELSGKAGAGLSGLAQSAYILFTPLLSVTDETVELALSLDGGSLGANDRIHVATCRQHGIETIVSADADFDQIRGVRRIDPLERRALSRLLTP